MKISMELFHQYIAIFFNFSTTSNHLHPLQVENFDSNWRLVVDEDNNKFRLEKIMEFVYESNIISRDNSCDVRYTVTYCCGIPVFSLARS